MMTITHPTFCGQFIYQLPIWPKYQLLSIQYMIFIPVDTFQPVGLQGKYEMHRVIQFKMHFRYSIDIKVYF